MALTVNQYLRNLKDTYRPLTPKPALQQYSPYQTDDIYCTDITYRVSNNRGISYDFPLKAESKLAVQAYAIKSIHCNFNQIARDYP
jgi:hypothetical protein